MSEYATKQDVQEIVGKAVTDLSGVITDMIHHVDDRFLVGLIDMRRSKQPGIANS